MRCLIQASKEGKGYFVMEWECAACHKKHTQEFSYCCPECDSERESGDLEVGEDSEN